MYGDILRKAANEALMPPGGDNNRPHPSGKGWYWHRYSCNAILFQNGPRPSPEATAARDWYYFTILCADRAEFRVSEMPDQETRFMTLLFASYLADDLGL